MTAHGTVLAYVFPTLFAMGFAAGMGLALARHSSRADRDCDGGRGNTTDCSPRSIRPQGSPFYYIGILIAVLGSWLWIG